MQNASKRESGEAEGSRKHRETKEKRGPEIGKVEIIQRPNV